MLSLILIFESQTKFVQSVTYIEIKIKSTCNDCLQGKFKLIFSILPLSIKKGHLINRILAKNRIY